MARLIKQDRGNYTNTSNQVIRDDRLTWKARGIFNYLWSQADEWQFYVSEIAQHAKDGVKSTRSGLDELEKYGYLKRVNRHDDTGSFDGMDWILSDMGGLNDESSVKESQVDSEDHRRDHFGDDAEKAQKVLISCQNGSDAKQVRRETGPTRNGTLRNNNIKNYQQQEISNKRKENNSPAPSAEQHISYKEIIDYLNKKTKAHYKASSKVNQRLIKARFKEGYTLEDFKTVINNKAFEWQHSDMWKYMRPSTLFGAHFDDYLNENKLKKSVGTVYRNNQGKRVEQGTDWDAKAKEAKQVNQSNAMSTEELKSLFSNLNNGKSNAGGY